MRQQDRQPLAAEVVEIGEQLFSLALEAQTSLHNSSDEDTQEQQAFPLEEIAAASGEFFMALRLLFDISKTPKGVGTRFTASSDSSRPYNEKT